MFIRHGVAYFADAVSFCYSKNGHSFNKDTYIDSC